MRSSKAFSTIAIVTLGMIFGLPADAVTQSRTMRYQGGTACQLSIPTIDTSVRPRATGFRNEGTTSAFVICGLPSPDGDFTGVFMVVQTLDGADHVVTCTGVNGLGSMAPLYATRSVSTGTNNNSIHLQWAASDFGGQVGENFPENGFFSATCTLPAQVAITAVYAYYDEDVGT